MPLSTAELKICYISGLVMMQISSLADLYTICLLWIEYKKKGPLNLNLRCPLYLALTDLLTHMFTFENYLVPVVTGRVVPDPYCRYIGMGLGFFAGANMMTIVTITIITYFSVFRNLIINTGKYDWKMLVAIFLSVGPLIAFGYNSFGSDGIWCYSSISTPIFASYLSTCFISTMFAALCLFSIYIMILLRRNEKQLINQKDQLKNYKKIERDFKILQLKMFRKQTVYVLSYVIQWGPVIPYMIRRSYYFAVEDNFSLVLAVAILLNTGGVLNTIALTINM
jgi:hypothetical protein